MHINILKKTKIGEQKKNKNNNDKFLVYLYETQNFHEYLYAKFLLLPRDKLLFKNKMNKKK